MSRPITAAVVDAFGRVRSLLLSKEPPEEVTEEQVKNAKTLSRLQMRVLRSLAALERRPAPRRIDFEDVEVNGDGLTVYTFSHGFGGRVRWWVVDCLDTSGGLHTADTTDENTLVLLSEQPGTVTVRIEEVG